MDVLESPIGKSIENITLFHGAAKIGAGRKNRSKKNKSVGKTVCCEAKQERKNYSSNVKSYVKKDKCIYALSFTNNQTLRHTTVVLERRTLKQSLWYCREMQ